MLSQLIQATKGRYEILTEESGSGLGIVCKDRYGNVVASRTVSHGQLRNAFLVETVMIDLQRTLLNRVVDSVDPATQGLLGKDAAFAAAPSP